MADSFIVDLTRLESLASVHPKLVTELISVFRQETERHLEDLRAAAEQRDVGRARESLHTLKGSCANVGAVAMEQLALDAYTGELAPEDLSALVARLAESFETTQAAFEAWRARTP